MKEHTDLCGRTMAQPAGIVFRFFIFSAALGLIIGIFEAALLWTTPRVILLLQPDVGYVIWFLAPLVDMIFFALMGLVVGWLASHTGCKEVPVAVEVGITITFVILMLKWFHVEIGLRPLFFDMEVLAPLLYFAAGFTASLVLLAVTLDRVASISDRWVRALLRPLKWGLTSSTVVAVVGIITFLIWPPMSGPAAPATAAPSLGAPNIVLITLDTVRADHLSAYGYSRPTTPNLDRFARTGVLFENAIAASSWTLASHASMFTGLLPQQHGADWAVPLSAGPSTLAEVLRSRGYETAGFVANRFYLQRGWGIAQGFDTYVGNSDSVENSFSETLIGNAIAQPIYQTLWSFDWIYRPHARELNRRVYTWLRHGPTHPFFLFINYLDTHEPYLPPKPFDNRFGKLSKDLARRFNDALLQSNARNANFTKHDRAQVVNAYDNCLAYLDGQVGDLLNFLRQSPGWQNTIVIITSDHGENFGGHGYFSHGSDTYRGVLHVPLIIAGPGIPKDLRISDVVATRQLFSTVLDQAGHGNTPFSGTSLTRFWTPGYKPAPSDDVVISELDPRNDSTGRHAMVSLTTSHWQYIEHRDGREELYNWKSDPNEQSNLAGAPGEQDTLSTLHSRLVNLVANATGPWRGPEYLQALDTTAGPARLGLLRPRPLLPDAPGDAFRIGMAQAFFKSGEFEPVRPSRAERDLIGSLPYQ